MSLATRNEVWDALPPLRFGEEHPLDLDLDATTERQVLALLLSRDFDHWSAASSRVGFCANPIRLVGRSETFDTRTGALVRSYGSADEALGVTFTRCGNRRADQCESCSRLYAADTFQLIRAGIAGGKTVPETVADNPLVFATLTAPPSGPCTAPAPTAAGAAPRRDSGHRCPHGRPTSCMAVHGEDDPAVGQPLCPDCYDYAWQVVWQWWAPELWRRFTITLRRLLAHHLGTTAGRLGEVASLQYAKVAEYQRRGAVHFHALIRLDGPQTADGFAPAPAAVTAPSWPPWSSRPPPPCGSPRHRSTTTARPGAGVRGPGRHPSVRTSRRTDDPDRSLTPEQVAGYLAKYATKSTGDTEAKDNPHLRRLEATARHLAGRAVTLDEDGDAPYGLLGKWAHTLGFRGHFATKSRRYSVTLGQLRRARQRAQARIAEANRTGTRSTCASSRPPPRRRRRRDHRRHRLVDLRRLRLGQRRRDRPGRRGSRPRPRVRPGAGSTPTRADEEEPRDE